MEQSSSLLLLSPELLIKIFSYLDTADFSQVAKACRPWSSVLRDEQLWRTAFIQQLTDGEEPPPLPLHSSWRTTYISKVKSRRLWAGGHQLAAYRFRDIGEGGIEDVRLNLDSRSIFVSSLDCLLHGAFTSDATLQRSSHYYSKTFDEEARVSAVSFSPAGCLAIGLDNSTLIVYGRIPTGSLTKNYQTFQLPPPASVTRIAADDQLPVQRIEWISESKILLLCRRGSFPSSKMILWDLSKSSPEIIVERPDINCKCVSGDGSVFWSSGGNLCCKRWSVKCHDDRIDDCVIFANMIFTFSRTLPMIDVINCEDGKLIRKLKLDEGKITHMHLSRDSSYLLIATDRMLLYKISIAREHEICGLEIKKYTLCLLLLSKLIIHMDGL